jgi:hypothetical protein
MEQITSLVERALASPTALWVMLVSGIVLFVLMTRELVIWFFRISAVLSKLDQIQLTLERLDARMKAVEVAQSTTNAGPLENIAAPEPLTKPGSSFPLQH